MHDAKNTLAINEGEPLAALQGIPFESLSLISVEQAVPDSALSVSTLSEHCRREIQAFRRGEPSNEAYGLELLHRAIVQGDQGAWIGLQQCLSEFVRSWLRVHPRREEVCCWESEETYVALAFERFWQATVQQQMTFRSLAGALTYLRASLHGAILDTLRAYARPREIPLPEPGAPGKPHCEDQRNSSEVWELLQKILLSAREQRLAYLLYHCGLKPRKIVRFCQQEFGDIQEIYHLRRNIVERVLRNADQLRWRLTSIE